MKILDSIWSLFASPDYLGLKQPSFAEISIFHIEFLRKALRHQFEYLRQFWILSKQEFVASIPFGIDRHSVYAPESISLERLGAT